MKKLITPNRVIIFGLILFIIILLFWKPCNKDAEEVAQWKAKYEQLSKEKQQEDKADDERHQRFSKDSADARGREQLAEREKLEADSKVKQQQTTIDRLAATIRRSNNQPVDTSDAVLVSRTYKNACDSFPPENDKLRAQLAEKDSSINQWSEILAYEIQLRDSALEAEQKHSARLNELYTRQSKITEDALKAAKPRGRLLGGVGLIGNEINFLSGTKINLAYQSKGGKQYQVGGMLFKGGVYYEATVLITLIK